MTKAEPMLKEKKETEPKEEKKESSLYDAVIELTKTVADLVKEQKTLSEQIEKSRKAGKF